MEKRISSSSHNFVKHLVRLNKDRSYRYQHKSLLVEGEKTLLDLFKRHTPLRIIVTEEYAENFAKHPKTIITDHIAQKISMVESPEGCFALFAMPAENNMPSRVSKGLVLDRLQDPGNVGTLLRTALAFGIKDVFLIEPSCDPWNPKVVRAAKGAQFDLNVYSVFWKDLPRSLPWYVADLQGIDLSTIRPDKWLLILGNEAQGPDLPKNWPYTTVTIPMTGSIESLNVAQAGAILLYTFSRDAHG